MSSMKYTEKDKVELLKGNRLCWNAKLDIIFEVFFRSLFFRYFNLNNIMWVFESSGEFFVDFLHSVAVVVHLQALSIECFVSNSR